MRIIYCIKANHYIECELLFHNFKWQDTCQAMTDINRLIIGKENERRMGKKIKGLQFSLINIFFLLCFLILIKLVIMSADSSKITIHPLQIKKKGKEKNSWLSLNSTMKKISLRNKIKIK